MSDTSPFAKVQEAPVDAVFGIEMAFRADTHPKKVNLGVGAYRTDGGKPYLFPSVIAAEKQFLADPARDKEYLPIDGLPALKKGTQQLLFGKPSGHIASMQTISGCGALRSVAEFIKLNLPESMNVYVSKPTWANHRQIFQQTGFTVNEYPYWNASAKCLDHSAMLESIKNMERGSLILLHACAHNPTGCDPTEAQWRSIAEAMKDQALIPILDSAYQGFASGDLEKDAWFIRFLNDSKFKFFVCQSFAKNMGLYGERAGMMHTVCENEEEARIVLSKMKQVSRGMISNPPKHAAFIVATILDDPTLYSQWEHELSCVANRIKDMRQRLREGLEAKLPEMDWSHFTTQIGMFCFTGFSKEICQTLTKEHHIYLLLNGRISMAGVNSTNVDYLVESFAAAVKQNSS